MPVFSRTPKPPRRLLALACLYGSGALLPSCSLDDRQVQVIEDYQGESNPVASTQNSESAEPDLPPSNPISEEQLWLVAEGSEVDLGVIPVGDTAPTFEWKINNAGTEPAEAVSWSTFSPQLVSLSSDCGARLEPGEECSLSVDYTQLSAGSQEAVVQFEWAGGELSLPISSVGHGWVEVTVSGQGRVVSEAAGIDCPGACRALVAPGVGVELSTTADPGWLRAPGPRESCEGTLSSCELQGPQNGNTDPATLNVEFYEQQHNLIFLSSQTYPPNLGGLAAYDAVCNTLASAAGINTPDGQGYLAAMSDSEGPFWQRFAPGVQGWTTLNAKPFADTLPRLIEQAVVYNALRFTERFTEVLPVLEETLSGTLADGTVGAHCDNWSATLGQYSAARPPYGGPGRWMGVGEELAVGLRDCDPDAPRRIACMGNTKTAPLSIETTVGKRIWLTTEPFAPGPVSPDEVCQQDRPAGVTTAMALVAHPGRRPVDLLDPEAVYLRPDGVRVGTANEIALAAIPRGGLRRPTLESGIWQTGDGAYIRIPQISLNVWSGSPTLNQEGTRASTCIDWQSSSEDDRANLGLVGALHGQFWSRGGDGPCSTLAHFYCIEQ